MPHALQNTLLFKPYGTAPNTWTKNGPQVMHKKRRGLGTRTHERLREAPLRETRQAAPDGARGSAALSSSETSRFSRGTQAFATRNGLFVCYVMRCDLYYRDTGIRIGMRRQHRYRTNLAKGSPLLWCCLKLPRAATDPRDENLKARFLGWRRSGQGGGGGSRGAQP